MPIRPTSGTAATSSPIRAGSEATADLEHLFQAVPLGVCLLDAQLRMLWINQRMATMLGSPHSCIGRCLDEIVDGVAVKLDAVARQVIERGETVGNVELSAADRAEVGASQVMRAVFFPLRSDERTVRAIGMVVRHRDRSEKTWRFPDQQSQILAQVHESVISTNMGGVVETWNQGAERIYGYSAGEALGQHISFLYFPEDLPVFEAQVIKPLLATGEYNIEVRNRRKNGDEILVELRLSVLHDAAGSRIGMIGCSNDITERKRAARTLDDRLAFESILLELSAGFVNLPSDEVDRAIDGGLENISTFLDVDQSHLIEWSNDKTRLGITHSWKPDKRRSDREDKSRDLRDDFPWLAARILRGETAVTGTLGDLPAEAEYDRHMCQRLGIKSGVSIPLVVGGTVLGAVVFSSTGRERLWPYELVQRLQLVGEIFANALTRKRWDVALRRSEVALRSSQSDLQFLAGRILSAQEEERRRLARELHDDLTQRLAVLAIEVGKLEQRRDFAPEIVNEGLRKIQADLGKMSSQAHTISRQLHPSILDDLGLVDAIESECSSFAQREGICVNFEVDGVPSAIPNDVAVCLYRVAQESLRNIAKYAGTDQAWVTLCGTDRGLDLSITDGGVGFDPQKQRRSIGLGMAGMRERVRLIHGEIVIESAPGRGTEVKVRAPLPFDL